ncbi:MAG: ATP-dependent helicase [Syntrophales bacterium]|nr:ATP-dependent helicase [Syntrophales bacterium]
MIDYKRELNPEQFQIVMEEGGPLLVIAGAGSGKTRTLTYRVARLIESGVKPERMLLATFTNKAARSMLLRVQMLLSYSFEAGLERDISRLWGGTFHHIAHLILRVNAPLLGYERNFSIIDSEDARQLINTCISEAGVNTKPVCVQRTGRSDNFPRANVLGDIIGLSVNTKVPLDEIVAMRHPFFFHRLDDIKAVAFHYIHRKRRLNVMDFDDLLLNWKRLLTDFPDVLKAYAERFSHVLVDEYQDTSIIQADILDLLASRYRNLMVVGDDSQSIYSFRGANFDNFIKFPERYPDCNIFKLETNYRSTPEILQLANLSIVNNEKQFQKKLRAVRKGGIRPILVPAKDVVQQADFVTQRIIELIREGVPLHEIAVLYRAHYHSMELQMEMTRRSIPFEIRSGIRFFEQAHIKDVTSYMRIVVNPFDELAWKRVLRLHRKIGKATADRVWRFISSQAKPLTAIMTDEFLQCATKAAAPGLLKCRNTIKTILEESPERVPSEIIDVLLEGSYGEYLEESYSDAASREDDLDQLGNFSMKFDSLEDFLSELALLTNMTEEAGHDLDARGEDKVILSTIHQAKGLEWTIVFIIWCAEGMIPLARSLKDPDGEEEERRVFYVATTRAKDQLYLCYPLFNYARGMGSMVMNPSRFIRELSPLSCRAKDRPYDQWFVEEE